MANTVRKIDEHHDYDPVAVDPALGPPLDPATDTYAPAADPVARDPRVAANDPYINNQVVQRGSGSGVILAAIVLVLAVAAFFIFGPGIGSNDVTADQPAATEPAPNTATPAPATESAAPAPSATAPQGIAPAEPVTPNPSAVAPAETAPSAAPATPTNPAPAQ